MFPIKVELCPSGFVTVTFASPGPCGGVSAVIIVESTTCTLVAALPSNVTVAPLKKFCPPRVTELPPVILPDCGVMELKCGRRPVGVVSATYSNPTLGRSSCK